MFSHAAETARHKLLETARLSVRQHCGKARMAEPAVNSSDLLRAELQRAGEVSVEALGKILDEKLQPLQKAIIELTAELQCLTRTTRSDNIDLRKQFIADKVIKSRPPQPNMSLSEILSNAAKLQHQNPKNSHYTPPPEWKVRSWSDMKDKEIAGPWISKIRAEPKYLPFEYLTKLGKERSATYRQHR